MLLIFQFFFICHFTAKKYKLTLIVNCVSSLIKFGYFRLTWLTVSCIFKHNSKSYELKLELNKNGIKSNLKTSEQIQNWAVRGTRTRELIAASFNNVLNYKKKNFFFDGSAHFIPSILSHSLYPFHWCVYLRACVYVCKCGLPSFIHYFVCGCNKRLCACVLVGTYTYVALI